MKKPLLKGLTALACFVASLFIAASPSQAATLDLELYTTGADYLLDEDEAGLFPEYYEPLLYVPPLISLADEATSANMLDLSTAKAALYPIIYQAQPSPPQHDSEEPVEASILSFMKPVRKATISSVYGQRWGRPHRGIDMAAPTGTPIHASENGRVIFSGPNGAFGNFVAIDHGYGYVTRYAHSSKILVRNGQKVGKGQLIAKVGSTGRSTGPHLHFEVLAHGAHKDPQEFINQTISIAN